MLFQGMMDDTIVAISTPIGTGGIGIVRLSGRDAVEIVSTIFKGRSDLRTAPSHTIHYGFIGDESSGMVDEVLVTIMRAPKTYTREDVVEINCHGGIVPLRKIMKMVMDAGARMAQPGEFTKRAFLNGRIDLAQAEAVLGIVQAKTEASLRLALNQLEGGLSREIRKLIGSLIDVLAWIEANIDFVEDEIDPLDMDGLLREILRIKWKIDQLLETARQGSLMREGIRTVLLGRPNVGKSTILNLLLGRNRSIVTDVPGTTRDTIEEVVDIDGIPLLMIDTAGVRDTDEVVELEGVRRTLATIDLADLILLVLDASEPLTKDDKRLINEVLKRDKEAIFLLNKIDLPIMIKPEELIQDRPIVRISALKGEGVGEMKEMIKGIFFNGKIPMGESVIITHERHKRFLLQASTGLCRAVDAIKRDETIDVVALDIREAIDSLSGIIGERVDEEILDTIFSRFCIGK